MHEIHEGVCGTDASGHVMARQIIKAGYYWMTLENYCINYVRKCHKCQIYADKIHVPPTSLNVRNGVAMAFLNVGHGCDRFIFIVIDYFTKWVEAASYASVTKTVVARFIKKELIC